MTIGVLGGGQLGRMLALAGYPLGFRFRFYDPAPDAPAEHVAEQWIGSFDDQERLARFAHGLDVITYEFENVPVAAAQFLARHVRVEPSPGMLETAQDRLREKTLFERLGVATNRYAAVDDTDSLRRALSHIGLPCVLKTRTLGYDGKGQWLLHDEREAFAALHAAARPLLLESLVAFERELSLVAVRARNRELRCYDLVENRHAQGILRETRAPAPGVTAEITAQARAAAQRIGDALDAVGVFAIEFFEFGGRLLANEIAPRVHNSGHWSIEGAATSQFENHLRAICGLPLGSTAAIGHSCMLNLIGELPAAASVLAIDGAHLHLYGKTPRAGRKLGHVTIWGATDSECSARRAQLLETGILDRSVLG